MRAELRVTPGGKASPAVLRSAAGAALVVDVDLFHADGLGDLSLVGDGVLVEADALLGDGALFGDDLFLVEDDLVLFVGDRGALGGRVDVGVGDRLALDPDFLALDGHGLGDLVLDDVLAQPRAAALALGGADVQLFLGARHRLVGGRAGGVVADGAGLVRAIRAGRPGRPGRAGRAGAALGQAGVRTRL